MFVQDLLVHFALKLDDVGLWHHLARVFVVLSCKLLHVLVQLALHGHLVYSIYVIINLVR
jgi:hypothetical protein